MKQEYSTHEIEVGIDEAGRDLYLDVFIPLVLYCLNRPLFL